VLLHNRVRTYLYHHHAESLPFDHGQPRLDRSGYEYQPFFFVPYLPPLT
jgi:hypothetical protein